MLRCWYCFDGLGLNSTARARTSTCCSGDDSVTQLRRASAERYCSGCNKIAQLGQARYGPARTQKATSYSFKLSISYCLLCSRRHARYAQERLHIYWDNCPLPLHFRYSCKIAAAKHSLRYLLLRSARSLRELLQALSAPAHSTFIPPETCS